MTLLLIVVKVLIVAAAVTGLVAYGRVLQRARRRRDPASQFVRLTAARRATLDETSKKPDIGATARPGATVALSLHKRNGRRPKDGGRG